VKALVTGAAGFIGSHVVRSLLARGWDVRALHLASDDLRNLRGLGAVDARSSGGVERFVGDVTDAGSLREAVRGVTVVFHLAAVFSLDARLAARMRLVNVEGTRRVLEAAREAGVERVVHTSSIARFGGQGLDRRATEESPFALGDTGDAYSVTKADAHEVAVRASRDHDVVIAAPCGPIGPGDVGPTPTGLLLRTLPRLPVVTVMRSATCFAHVKDMAEGIVLAAERGRRGESYLLGTEDVWLGDLARMALRAIGAERPVVEVPPRLARVGGSLAELGARLAGGRPIVTRSGVLIAERGLRADTAKAARELGVPRTPVEVAVREALAWFRENPRQERDIRAGMPRRAETGPGAFFSAPYGKQ